MTEAQFTHYLDYVDSHRPSTWQYRRILRLPTFFEVEYILRRSICRAGGSSEHLVQLFWDEDASCVRYEHFADCQLVGDDKGLAAIHAFEKTVTCAFSEEMDLELLLPA
jgi:hypothetical protein